MTGDRGAQRRNHLMAMAAGALLALAPALGSPGEARAQLGLPSILTPVSTQVCTLTQGVAASLATVPVAGSATGSAANTICSLLLPQFTYVTVYDPPGDAAPVRRTHTGFVGVPASLDVGAGTAPDLTATLTVLPVAEGKLRVARAAGAPLELPVSIEAIVAIPQSGSGKAAVGYDALASNAPGQFSADYTFDGDTTSVKQTTAAPGPSLAALAEVFTPGSGDARVNPQKLRVAFAPVPATAVAAVKATTVVIEVPPVP